MWAGSARPANADLIPVVDISDLSMAPTGTTKQITYQSLLSAVNTDLPPAVDWVNVTNTEYGAVGNGRADDTHALQRAIAAATRSVAESFTSPRHLLHQCDSDAIHECYSNSALDVTARGRTAAAYLRQLNSLQPQVAVRCRH